MKTNKSCLLIWVILPVIVLAPTYGVSAKMVFLKLPKVAKQINSAKTAFRLQVSVEKGRFQSEEPLNLRLSIMNISHKAGYLLETSPIEQYELIIRDEMGQSVSITEEGKKIFKSHGDHFRRFLAKITASMELKDTIEVNKIYNMTAPGIYSISAKRRIFSQKGEEFGVVISNEIKVSVTN